MRLARRRNFLKDARANVALIFALSAFAICMMVIMGVDITNGLRVKTALQDATDGAALAVSVAVSKSPKATNAQLTQVAQTFLAANFHDAQVTIASLHICSQSLNDCTSATGPMKMNTIDIDTTAQAPCPMTALSGLVCTGSPAVLPVKAESTTVIGVGATIQLNIVMDGSASMIVGATPADVAAISTWTSNNWNAVKPGDPAPSYPGGDNPPCAFACHDVGSSTTAADVAAGLTNAHAAGATTRFDVMTAAAQQLISHIQAESTASHQVPAFTYEFNVMSFDTSLHQYGGSNLGFSNAAKAVTQVGPGLDTYLSSAMTQLAGSIGANGTGQSANSPIKFLILVTDGLESDRSNNWSCTSWAMDSAWNYNTCYGGFAKPIDPSQCAAIKNAGVVVGVLETPYVPLTGQSPNVAPYEKTVRHVIYPGGPNTSSTVSAALSSCASAGYYFQATSSSDIATGFLTLADKFIASQTRIAG